ncbi:MAG: DUF58 domain-containing protein [Gammaproteobacteria bacterium]|nr:DUF58 domain-containing protein [Gammaproteobacteria bacterium]
MSAAGRVRSLVANSARDWAWRRQGPDRSPVTLARQRIYILPTGQGLVFALLLLGMLLGAMNYNNNLGFGVTFLLAGLALVSMYHCHANLQGLKISTGQCEPVFAGQQARPAVRLHNDGAASRYGLALLLDSQQHSLHDLAPGETGDAIFTVDAPHRGRIVIDRFSVASRFPFGLFRAWAWLHMPLECIVYPRPAENAPPPPTSYTDTGGAQHDGPGDDDFAGLRDYRAGDSPRHIAWKAFARRQELLVRQFAGTRVVKHIFDLDDVPATGLEQRLSILCRWILDAHAAGEAFGIRVPGAQESPAIGASHLHRCLRHLALFGDKL